MNQHDEFIGGVAPFQGDRTLTLRSIPANARIVKATATVTPLADPFTQVISFADGQTFGATKSPPGDWVEVDFHARRTLVSVAGSGLTNISLQADFGGGVYVDISETGAVKGPEFLTGLLRYSSGLTKATSAPSSILSGIYQREE